MSTMKVSGCRPGRRPAKGRIGLYRAHRYILLQLLKHMLSKAKLDNLQHLRIIFELLFRVQGYKASDLTRPGPRPDVCVFSSPRPDVCVFSSNMIAIGFVFLWNPFFQNRRPFWIHFDNFGTLLGSLLRP